MEKIAYLGPDGSYTHHAAKLFCPDAEMIAEATFHAVMHRLLSGGADYAVMPINNSINGGVVQNIDLLQENDCVAVSRLQIRIEHRLATKKGADLSAINRVYSHSQALDQCGKYLAAHFPEAKLVAVSSTVQGAKCVQSATDAAIAPADCGVEGLEFSTENIADEKDNFTTFLLVRRGKLDDNAQSNRVYLSATCCHEPGALVSLLQVLSRHGVNMTKIESRPIKDRVGEFRFFIEIEGDYSSKEIKTVLAELSSHANSVKILGAY